MKKFIWIFLIVLLLLAAGVILLLWNPFMGSTPVDAEDAEDAEEAVRPKNVVSYDPGGTFITNLKDSRRFLKVSLIIELENKKQVSSMTKENYRIRDTISYILSSYTEDEVREEGIREHLKLEIRENLEEKIDIKGIVDIFFNEFIIQ